MKSVKKCLKRFIWFHLLEGLLLSVTLYKIGDEAKILMNFFSLFQVWFKNRRAKCRQQTQHQASTNLNSSKTSGNSTSSSTGSSTRHTNSNNTNNNTSSSGNSTNHHNSNHKTTMSGSSSTKTTPIKLTQVSSSVNNSLNGLNLNSSPVLPMTPSTSVSPPVNIICKKEINPFHPNSTSVPNDLKPVSSIHNPYNDGIKCESELAGLSHHSVYSNINSRLGQSSGNLTPMGSSSSIQTTPSPPITPQSSINPLAYVPNHDYNNAGFWQYGNPYPSNYGNTPYYSSQQMEYFQNQNANNYNLSHSGYSSGNFSLSSGAALGQMSTQPFTQNSLDYLSPADKYANMC